MDFTDDLTPILLGLAALLLLSLYTLAQCFSQRTSIREPRTSFLFGALARRHSLASAVGSAFSITYLGAATIWGHLYRGWFLLYLAVAFVTIAATARFIIRLSHRELSARGIHEPDNVLLEFLRVRLSPSIFKAVLRVYALIYFLLLVEELAVGRVVLRAIFPSFPAITAAILATILVVVATYLQWGGFRGVLLADFEQLKILLPFLVVLGALIFVSLPSGAPSAMILATEPAAGIAAFPLGLLLFSAWLAGSVDFYSRLNYQKQSSDAESENRQFAAIAVALLCVSFAMAGTLGALMPGDFGADPSPTGFVNHGIRIVTTESTRAVSLVFFAGVFWMLFTTLSNLAITLLQVRQYLGRPYRTGTVSRLLLLAAALSCLVWPDSVSAVGVFVGALLVIPLISIATSLFEPLARWAPKITPYPTIAGALAIIFFVIRYQDFEEDYYTHTSLPLLVLAATAIALLIGLLWERRGKGARS